MEPAASMGRRVVTVVCSTATVSAIAAPTLALEPSASPSASVTIIPFDVARRLRVPRSTRVPLPSCAKVSTTTIAMATTGVTAVPPSAPPSA